MPDIAATKGSKLINVIETLREGREMRGRIRWITQQAAERRQISVKLESKGNSF
jgi:hypothetical protein